jgi:hypothetical protein
VTVGAIAIVGVRTEFAEVGEDSGVAKIFGVGVGGLSNSAGSDGATFEFT